MKAWKEALLEDESACAVPAPAGTKRKAVGTYLPLVSLITLSIYTYA